MNRTNRKLLLAPATLLTFALLASACGDDSGDASSTTTVVAETTVVEATTTTEAPKGPHDVVHAMGTTEVPGDPQRVVVLDSSFLDAAVALGVTPVGATEAAEGEGMPPYLRDALGDDIEVVGIITTPNVEAVAAARPDLILGAKVRHEAIYEQLSRIAPTVFTESSGTKWRDGLKVTADALGKTAEADALLAGLDARAKAVGEKVGAAGKTASIVRFVPGQIRLYGPDTFSGSVLTLVGFDLGEKGFDANPYSMAMISPEQLGLADADVIFATNRAADGAGFAAVEPLWTALPAVVDGRQFDVEDDEWMLGIGVIGADIILDDIEELLG
jgi:iron complex transport system substrate-binding protein